MRRRKILKSSHSINGRQQLSPAIRNAQLSTPTLGGKMMGGRVLPYQLKSVSRIRADIKAWNRAQESALNAEYPSNYEHQELLTNCLTDALLTSQIQNRKNLLIGSQFNLVNEADEPDEEQTKLLRNLPATRTLMHAVLDSIYHGYSLVELELTPAAPVGVSTKRNQANRGLKVISLPRTNIIPRLGRFLPDAADLNQYVEYRKMREFGTWILEFYEDDLGLLNKAVPHVLFKRFAQSCWSELCEIYGIPPRVMKTNVQDPAMLNRAEAMMRDMGAAAWFIIDETENFEWAETQATNGDVYSNLINLCDNQNSLLISGAVIGQDTKNGNRSKEESSQDVLWNLVLSDMELMQTAWNHTIIPALVKLGIIKPGLSLRFEPEADLEALYKYTLGFLTHYTIAPDWIEETFGIPVEAKPVTPPPGKDKEEEDLSYFFE